MRPDFEALAAILEANKDKPVSEEHWDRCRPVIARNAKRLEDMEKAAELAPEMIHKPFTV